MFSELNLIQGSTASRYLSSSFHFLTTHQRETSFGLAPLTSYTHAASLDTEPLARSYSGRILTCSSFNYFPYESCNGLFVRLSLQIGEHGFDHLHLHSLIRDGTGVIIAISTVQSEKK
jgi:hypothetical protein